MVDTHKTVERLREHVHQLTVIIGERSVRLPENLEKTAAYIESFYRGIDLPVQREPYRYRDFDVANIVAELDFSSKPGKNYLLGAHYDSVWGTVGADDNASAIAVQLEIAWQLQSKLGEKKVGSSGEVRILCTGRAAGLWHQAHGKYDPRKKCQKQE